MNNSKFFGSSFSFGMRDVQQQETLDWLEVTPGHYTAQHGPYSLSIFAIMVGRVTFMIYGSKGKLIASGNCSSIRDAKAQAERRVAGLNDLA